MTTPAFVRPTINRYSDLILRLFIDTNVLIDYIEKFPDTHAIKFIDTYCENKFENIELITSDYVLWEFYGHFRDELYTKKLVADHHYGYVSANKTCFKGGYPRASLPDMEQFGETIKTYEKELKEKKISVEKLVGKNHSGFSELVETILQRSKFSYKDSIVFVSAVYTGSSILITLDDHFSCDDHLKELKEALKPLVTSLKLDDIGFKRPIDFADVKSMKRNYKEWFIKKNEPKVIGKVIKTYSKSTVLGIQCSGDNYIEVGDWLCVVKFDRLSNFFINIFQIKANCLKDYDRETDVTKGTKITAKPPEELIGNCDNALVFLYEN
jgi:hypothetical protein